MTFPEHGTPVHDVLTEVDRHRAADLPWRTGRAFSLVYHADDPELEGLQHEVAHRFIHENALNPFAYPSLLTMEADVVAMAADLFGGPARAGSMSSGGTESIFLAVHTARELGRDRGVAAPTIVTPSTAHPAFAKACHYLGVDQVRVPVGRDGRADLEATRAAVDDETVLVVGSAPNYPYGVIDPIAELAAIAVEAGTLCHVDACLGGWLLPFWAELGESVPAWDLRTPGVTSLSADLHKYGYCFKGASVIVYNDRELLKKQHFIYDAWPGGLYGSATTAGTRPAAPIAAAWATLTHLGRAGLLAKAEVVRDTTVRFLDAIAAIGDLRPIHPPDMSVFAFTSEAADISAIGDVMDDRGWHLDRQQEGLHLMVSPGHAPVVDDFAADLAHAYEHHGDARGAAAVYGASPT